MAKPSITNITTAQSFQNWLDKTNEMVNIFKSEVVTASSSGDTTIGDATLTGDFQATNLIADTLLSTDTVASQTGGAVIDFQSSIDITAPSSPICATFTYGTSGGRTRYTDGTIAWDVGMEDSTNAHFIINTGIGGNKFELSPAGTLYVEDIIVAGDITANNIVGTVSGNTDGLTEGSTNLFYTDTRARSAVTKTHVDGLNVDAGTLDGINSTSFARTDTTGESFDGALTVGTTLGVSGQATFANNLLVTGNISTNSDVYCGNVRATGTVITNYSTSDIRLKENLEVIDKPLEKIELINGYTFNYKNNKDERVTGLVAQELEHVLPEAVFEFEDGDNVYKAIHYGNTVSLLVEAIKELKLKVEELERKAGE